MIATSENGIQRVRSSYATLSVFFRLEAKLIFATSRGGESLATRVRIEAVRQKTANERTSKN